MVKTFHNICTNPLVEKLCEPDADIPNNLIQCGSCQNRCGTKLNPDHFRSCDDKKQKYLSSCDKFCNFHGDCCHDFNGTTCPNEFRQYQDISHKYPFKHAPSDFVCENFNAKENIEINNLVIVNCPDGSKCGFKAELNDINTFIPMYDIHRGVHYVSGQCAQCNGAVNVKPWNIIVDCLSQNEKEHLLKQMTGLSLSCKQTILFYSPTGEPRPCLQNMQSNCKSSCRNQNLRNL